MSSSDNTWVGSRHKGRKYHFRIHTLNNDPALSQDISSHIPMQMYAINVIDVLTYSITDKRCAWSHTVLHLCLTRIYIAHMNKCNRLFIDCVHQCVRGSQGSTDGRNAQIAPLLSLSLSVTQIHFQQGPSSVCHLLKQPVQLTPTADRTMGI